MEDLSSNAPSGDRPHAHDEISLRELYLVLKGALGWILLVPMFIAVAAFVWLRSGSDSFTSEAVVVVTPPAIAIQGARGVTFQPSSVRFETYSALARSSPVLQAVAEHPAVVAGVGRPLSLRSVRSAVDLRQLAAQNSDAMTVSHTVAWGDAEIATLIANTWAAESLEAVRFTLLDSLGPVDDATRNEVMELGRALEATEAALELFDGANLLELTRGQLAGLSERVTREEFAISDLGLQIAVAEARTTTLLEQLAEEVAKVTSSDPASDTFLAGLALDDAIALLGVQRDVAATAWQRARAALDAFDAEHNLSLFGAEIDEYTNLLASATIDIERLNDRLEFLRASAHQVDAQLRGIRATVATTDSRSDQFLSDLTLADAQAYLDAETERLATERTRAMSVLNAFDAEHDVDRIGLTSDDLTRRIISRQATLDGLPGRLSIVQDRISALEGALSVQPQQLVLLESILRNPLLLESAREEGADGLLLGTERSELNPTFVNLTNRLNDAYVEASALREERRVLEAELAEMETELGRLRAERIALSSERSSLEFSYALANDLFRATATRADGVRAAAADPRGGDRVLRSAAGTLLADLEADLEAQRLSIDRDIARTGDELRILTNRIQRAEERLPDLRATRIDLTTQRRELEAEADRTEAQLRSIDARLDTIRLTELDPRGSRALRDTTPEVLQSQSRLRDERLAIDSYRAELTARTAQFANELRQLAEVRQTAARLETERSQLARAVSNARSAYEDVAPLGPIIAYMTQLAPTTARVVASATPPADPDPRSTSLVSALVFVVSAFGMVVGVLLREAVRDPSEPRGLGTAQGSWRRRRRQDREHIGATPTS